MDHRDKCTQATQKTDIKNMYNYRSRDLLSFSGVTGHFQSVYSLLNFSRVVTGRQGCSDAERELQKSTMGFDVLLFPLRPFVSRQTSRIVNSISMHVTETEKGRYAFFVSLFVCFVCLFECFL